MENLRTYILFQLKIRKYHEQSSLEHKEINLKCEEMYKYRSCAAAMSGIKRGQSKVS